MFWFVLKILILSYGAWLGTWWGQEMLKSSMWVKAVLMLLALLSSWYLLLSLGALRAKKNRLDRIMEIVIETKERMLSVHHTSQDLALKMARLDKLN